MPRTEQANQQIRDDRKEQILDAAAKVFARNGFVGTRIDDIAAAAGISKGLIYHYFGSKDAIFNTLIDRAASGTIRLHEYASDRPESAKERLRWLIGQVAEGLADHAHTYLVVQQAFVSDAVPEEARQQIAVLGERTGAILQRMIAEGQASGEIVEGDPEHLSFLLGSCLQGLASAESMSGSKPAKSMADSLFRLFTNDPKA